MDSNSSNWRESSKCKFCKRSIWKMKGLDSWSHIYQDDIMICRGGDHPEPVFYGTFETLDIGMVTPYEEGYNVGSAGKSDLDNPYGPGGKKYDGVDSQGAAFAWYSGWVKAYKATPQENNGLDYLESERG